MAIPAATPGRPTVLSGWSRLAYLAYAGLAAIAAWWAWRAFHDPSSWDTGLAYRAGQVGWATGHPEHVRTGPFATWISTPFLGAMMSLVSRAVSIRGAANLVTVLNVAMWIGAAGVVLHRTRRLLSPVWWWTAAFGLLSFGPLMSSVWWKQFNVIALVLALAGFELVRQRRVSLGAAAIGLSVAVKPMVILLPFVMLARRETRRAGALTLAWIAAFNVAAQALMAARAHDLATLDPLIGVRNFLGKTPPEWGPFLCEPSNFAPGSLLCRAMGGWQNWTLQRVAVLCALVLLGAWVIDALRGRAATSWEVFAFTCALSAMLSPLAWTHYQIMLAPLLFLLLFRFAREGASVGAWSGLTVAFALASLIWLPYGTIVGAIWGAVSGVEESQHQVRFLDGIAQFSQYILIVTGVLWYIGRQAFGERSASDAPEIRRAGPNVA